MKDIKRVPIILTVAQACELLKSHNIIVQPSHLRAGLIARAYPFGVAFKLCEDSSRYVYEIYAAKLLDWIHDISRDS